MAGAIAGFVAEPARWSAASRAGVAAAHRFTYSAYQTAVAGLFTGAWGVRLAAPAGQTRTEAISVPGRRDDPAGPYSRNGYH
jgi:hypothetical protein